MASAARRARRKQPKMTLESILAELNASISKLDSFAQQAHADEATNPGVTARLTQTIILAGTATEILGGLVQAEKMAELRAQADETTEE